MTTYDADVVAWDNEQSHFLRAGKFDHLDIEHLADETEDVGKAEQRDLAKRMAVLLAELLKWNWQPAVRGLRWPAIIAIYRKVVIRRIELTPSLKLVLQDALLVSGMCSDAVLKLSKETDIEILEIPETCPWAIQDVLTEGWFLLCNQVA